MSGVRSVFVPVATMLLLTVGLAGCDGSASTGAAAPSSAGGNRVHVVEVAASIDAWGSILSQLGGVHVHTTSIISNPDTDPHDYEPTPADGRTIATAKLFVENGIGYDSWADEALKANPEPSRAVIDVGALTGIAADGNPHRWYSPDDVAKVADAITAGLKKSDPADAAYFDSQRETFETTGLAEYHQLIVTIKARYAGTPVGASESIFTPLSETLGLDLVTPASFLKDTNEGTDPSAADKATIDAQISDKLIKTYVFNTQNATPDIAEQAKAAKAAGIPVLEVTETLSPKGASFQDWQSAQLKGLQAALAQGTGQ